MSLNSQGSALIVEEFGRDLTWKRLPEEWLLGLGLFEEAV
jgi:hypothetical protein